MSRPGQTCEIGSLESNSGRRIPGQGDQTQQSVGTIQPRGLLVSASKPLWSYPKKPPTWEVKIDCGFIIPSGFRRQ